ncbi:MAG: DUF2752 domain-containing protein [Fimbriimonadaceae bacterium]|nr:DUF2752 domain-containing protein [Fimbriimonadaceae bacterium]
MPKCAFHELTGLYCPGCGGTRAMRALLSADVAGSLHQNALLPLALLAAATATVRIIDALRQRKPVSWHVSGGAGRVIAIVVIAYAVLRNVPLPLFDAWRPT